MDSSSQTKLRMQLRRPIMTLKHIALVVSLSLLALAGCHAHVGVGEKAPASTTQYGSPS
jgi:hypothetical protein